MATYSADAITGDGDVPTIRTAASGDKITPDNNLFIRVTNGAGTDVDLTIAVPGNTSYGEANPDKVITITAGATAPIRLYPTYADPSDGLIALSWESTTSVTFTVERV